MLGPWQLLALSDITNPALADEVAQLLMEGWTFYVFDTSTNLHCFTVYGSRNGACTPIFEGTTLDWPIKYAVEDIHYRKGYP